jgi:RHS repeat-associated protein
MRQGSVSLKVLIAILWIGIGFGAGTECAGAVGKVSLRDGPGYAGQWWNSSLQSYQLRARSYDPASAQFLGPDTFEGTIQQPESRHRYSYAHADPINGLDPSGHSFISDVLLSSQVRTYMAAQSTGPLVTSAKAGLGVLTLAAAVHDPESFAAAFSSPAAAAHLLAEDVAFVAHYGRRTAQFVSGYLMARWKIQPALEEILAAAAQRIRGVDPDAIVGYRGSIARGYKGAHKNNDPFDPSEFDVDGFIVSDRIAATLRVHAGSRFLRSGSDPTLRMEQKAVDQALRSKLEGMKPGAFRFRIYTTEEFLKKQASSRWIEE